MSQFANVEKSKDKKKSFVERFFNFASHTMKANKKSDSNNHKKKLKKLGGKHSHPDNEKLSKSMLQLELQTCTFCDYCDGEIVADFTGQSIIFHDACKKKHEEVLDVKSSVDLEKSNEIFTSIKSEVMPCSNDLISNAQGRLSSRLSISLGEINVTGVTTHDDATIILRKDRENSLNNYFVDGDTGSYTFSTVDLPTIRQYGISIKKVSSNENDVSTKNEEIFIASSSNNKAYSRSRSSSLNYQAIQPEALKKMMEVFNKNDQGLFIESKNDKIMGKIRVFINLLRPIKMLLTARPPSIFDSIQENNMYTSERTIDRAYYNKEVIFWLPRGTTKLLYIDKDCKTSDVITLLLSKFNIQNNPKKFALYEHSIKSQKEVEVYKLKPSQYPLKIMMDWCARGLEFFHENLETKRFVLQENDPGSIEWDEFCIPELKSFLIILGQEEDEKKKQISRKYDILRSEIFRRMTMQKSILQPTGQVVL